MTISEKFKNRINELVEENTDRKVVQLAVEMKLDYRTLSYAIKYGIVPSTRKLITIADFFNVSIPYLLGESDNYYFEIANERKTFAQRLKEICEERGQNTYQLSVTSLGNGNYIQRWIDKNYIASLNLVETLASHLDVSIDYLLGRTDERKYQNIALWCKPTK